MQNKTIWLIGASFGIGETLCQKLATNNTLILSARSASKLTTLQQSLPNANKHTVLPLDVTNSKSMQNSFNVLQNTNIDCIIYLSGVYETGNLVNVDMQTGINILNTNLIGALHLVNLFTPKLMQQKNNPSIVLTASAAAYVGLPNSGFYGVSKAGVLQAAEQLKLDLAPFNIKVQVINPGFVKTRLTDKNNFNMPFLTDTNSMANYIVKQLSTNVFDINYPKQLTLMLKFIRILPYKWQFALLKKLIK